MSWLQDKTYLIIMDMLHEVAYIEVDMDNTHVHFNICNK